MLYFLSDYLCQTELRTSVIAYANTKHTSYNVKNINT